MRARYQRGHLRLGSRKVGPACWEFLWWDVEPTGIRVRRTAAIGTIHKYPTVEDACQASNGLRVSINEARNRQREQAQPVADLIDHYDKAGLSGSPGDRRKSHATRIVYNDFLYRWVRPVWGTLDVRAVRTIAVERWLHDLKRRDGKAMASATKARIRNVMSVLFNHAVRYEWLEQGRNPMRLARQSAKRQKIPGCLDAQELQSLLRQLDQTFRAMVFLDAVTGPRRSELLALKWEDTDFERR